MALSAHLGLLIFHDPLLLFITAESSVQRLPKELQQSQEAQADHRGKLI
jgi:hypothetical protein